MIMYRRNGAIWSKKCHTIRPRVIIQLWGSMVLIAMWNAHVTAVQCNILRQYYHAFEIFDMWKTSLYIDFSMKLSAGFLENLKMATMKICFNLYWRTWTSWMMKDKDYKLPYLLIREIEFLKNAENRKCRTPSPIKSVKKMNIKLYWGYDTYRIYCSCACTICLAHCIGEWLISGARLWLCRRKRIPISTVQMYWRLLCEHPVEVAFSVTQLEAIFLN